MNVPHQRNSPLEMLRIVAMVAIVAHHYGVHGGVMDTTESAGTAVALSVISGFGKWGVDLFVLVGAYFMVERATRGRALATIYSQVLPISWLILAITAVFAAPTLSRGDVVTALVPVIFSEYWFVTAYVMLVLIGPYLSMVAQGLSRIQLRRLIVVGIALWSVLTMVDHVWLAVSNLAWFALLFMIAAYIRLHPVTGTLRSWTIGAITSTAVLAMSLFAFTSISWPGAQTAADLNWIRDVLAGQYSPLALASALCVVVMTLKVPARHSPAINYWASAAFGVYLIHDHPLVRRWLWSDAVQTSEAAGHWWLPFHALLAVIAVYVAASVIIFALQPVALKPALRVTTAIRKRIEARLAQQ